MPLNALNHFTIRTTDLERTKFFYTDILGLPVGYRPPLGFPGYWLYCGDTPTVHLIGPRQNDPTPRTPGPTGLFDHIAFSCTGLAAMRTTLTTHNIPFTERIIPRDRQTQLFLHDPDGIAVELNYPPTETTG
jgi:catechol 2,3-dioxygenase-like lactoylglutathione lyase family enzyme